VVRGQDGDETHFFDFNFFSRGLQAFQKGSKGFRQRDITGVLVGANDVHDSSGISTYFFSGSGVSLHM
jgi:hypothetical protein